MANAAPVLIAGGGLVGLSAAAFLAQHNVKPLVLERLKVVSPLPRAAYFHMRTLELFRSLGIEERVVEGSARDFVPDGAIIARDTLAGRKLADIIPNLNAGVADLSPCRRLFLNQPNLEPILCDRALASGATILRGVEITGLNQDDDGVSVTIRDVESGSARELRGEYLVAADGGHSRICEALGIRHAGRGAFSHSVTIYFTADLSRFLRDNPWSLIYINNPTLRGFFRLNRTATAGFFAVHVVGDPAADPDAAANAAADVSEARLIALVRAGAGDPNLPVRIDGFSRWRATASVAQRFRDGRVFIAGDAAHLMPPNGGFGGNTGIHDAHNLAWKLALVLGGQANAALLESYERERRPVCRFIVEQAFSRYVARTAPWLTVSTRPDLLIDDFEIELGTLYDVPESPHADPHSTCGQPGSRLPHFWLQREGKRISTIDLTGRFLLLAGTDGAAWMDAAEVLRPSFQGLLFEALLMGKDLDDPEQCYRQAFGISGGGATLVRPDGFVAWRSPLAVGDAASALHRALHESLALGGPLR